MPADQRVAHATRVFVSISVALFFVQLTVLAPSDVEGVLGFVSRDLGHRWWTVVAFPFVHGQLLPLAANLIVIGVFGGTLERRWGTGEFIRYFATCALGAWAAHVTIVPGDTALVGAAGPAVGIMLAHAATANDRRHFRVGSISMSAGWFAVIVIAGIILSGVASTPPAAVTGAYLAHLGGLAAGWLYLRTASSINLVRFREGVSPVPDEPDDMPPRAIPRGQPRSQRTEDEIVARSNAAVAREALTQRPTSPAVPDVRDPGALNRLLDKISLHGIESLTTDERTLLDDASRRLRDR